MKKLLLVLIGLMLAGCVAVPVYDYGYYSPHYGPYPYAYAGPDVNVYFPGYYGGHVFRGGHGYYRGDFGFRGGDFGSRGGGFRGGGRR